jgi:hypothetical protein
VVAYRLEALVPYLVAESLVPTRILVGDVMVALEEPLVALDLFLSLVALEEPVVALEEPVVALQHPLDLGLQHPRGLAMDPLLQRRQEPT